jgi:hypothetical protein
VQAAELGEGLVDQCLDLVLVSDVSRDGDGSVDCIGGGFRGFGVDVGDDNAGAVSGEPACDGGAETGSLRYPPAS